MKIVIVDDYYVVRKGFCFFFVIQGDIEVVGEVVIGVEVFCVIEEIKFDFVLMDLFMFEMDGI